MSRNSLETQGDLVFYGYDGIEAEEFVRTVIRTAKAAGRFRDNDWIIEEVAAGFSGDALRWYIELDDETQNDWKLLRRAILQKYPPPSQRSQSDLRNTPLVVSGALPIVPTSAAAAPPPVSRSLSREAQNLFHIKIVFQGGGNSRYLGVENGDVVVTYTPLQAVTVRLCERTRELRLIREGNETGEKLAVRYSELSKIIFSFCWIRYARLEVVDEEGSSRARDPVSSGISITSWDVNNHNFLQATPQGDYPSSVDLYLDTSEARQQYQPIRAYLDRPIPLDSATEAQFLNLELEEV